MRMKRFKMGSALLLVTAACTGFPFFGRHSPPSAREASKPVGDAVQDIQYDGWTLSARVLVSPETGLLRLDRRLVPDLDVELWGVSDCKYGAVGSIRMDYIASRRRPEALLVLEPGYWYGGTVRFTPFAEHITPLGPECVEAYIRLFSFDGRYVTRQYIRAVRPSQQPPDGGLPMDEGVPEEPRPSGDAGSASSSGPQEVHDAGAGWE